MSRNYADKYGETSRSREIGERIEREFPTITANPSAMPEGLIAYLAEFEDMQGGTETKPMAASDIAQCALAASTWAKAHDMEVRWIAEFGWTEGLV